MHLKCVYFCTIAIVSVTLTLPVVIVSLKSRTNGTFLNADEFTFADRNEKIEASFFGGNSNIHVNETTTLYRSNRMRRKYIEEVDKARAADEYFKTITGAISRSTKSRGVSGLRIVCSVGVVLVGGKCLDNIRSFPCVFENVYFFC